MPGYALPPPPTAGGITPLIGALVLIDVLRFTPEVQTPFGLKPEVEGSFRVVEHPTDPSWNGQVLQTTAWNKMLTDQLRQLVGQRTLGRLVLGQARMGNNAPVLLDPPTEQEQGWADAVLAQLATAGQPPAVVPPVAPAFSAPAGPVAAPSGPAAQPPPGYPIAPAQPVTGAPAAPMPGTPPMPPGYPVQQPVAPPF